MLISWNNNKDVCAHFEALFENTNIKQKKGNDIPSNEFIHRNELPKQFSHYLRQSKPNVTNKPDKLIYVFLLCVWRGFL